MLISMMTLAMAVAAQAQADTPKVNDLAWLEGTWRGETEFGLSEETFTAPMGGMILETVQFVAEGKTTFFEFARIAEEGGTLMFRPSPMGEAGVAFKLSSLTRDEVVFENPENSFPSRVAYVREGEKTLLTQVEGTEGGKKVQWTFRYTKIK